MATQAQAKVFYHSGPHRVKWYPEASSQSFEAGSLVYLSSGLLTVVADDGQVILGMAMAAASTSATTTPTIPVLLASQGTEFVGNVYHSTEGSAITAITQCGENYAVQTDSAKHYVDIEDTTNVALRVVDLYTADAVGDTYGRVVFVVESLYSQADQAG